MSHGNKNAKVNCRVKSELSTNIYEIEFSIEMCATSQKYKTGYVEKNQLNVSWKNARIMGFYGRRTSYFSIVSKFFLPFWHLTRFLLNSSIFGTLPPRTVENNISTHFQQNLEVAHQF